jgi:putative DNA primase/helicase
MMTAVARCEDGEAVAHAWSSPYPSYSQAETQAKFDHAREEMSARSCATIAEEWEGCASCPHKGKIKSPADLREPPVHEIKRAIVEAALAAEDPHAALATTDVMEAIRWLHTRRPVVFLELEPRVRAAVKGGGGTLGAFRTALKAAVPPEDRERREQERDAKKAAAIMVSAGLLTEATKQTAHAIRSTGSATHPRLLVYAARLVEIIDANIEHGTIVQAIGPNRLAVIAGAAAYFAIVNDKGEVEDRDCPERICRALLENPVGYGFAILDGLSGVPVLREDGTIWQTPGYDRESRVYFDPQGIKYPAIPDAPTLEEAREAILRVAGYLDEVAFADDTAQAVGLSANLTAVARHAFPQAPGFHFDAPQQSSGKTHMAKAVATIAAGENHEALTTWPKDEEELRKAIMSHALAGRRAIILDNVPQGTAIDSPALCRFLTAGKSYSDRELGHSRTATVSPRITIMTTGNNVIPSGDLTSRILTCKLDRGEEFPEEHLYLRDLLAEVLEHRGQIVADLLTVIRGYLAAGEPPLDVPNCRMPEWARFARAPLVWLGLPDPLDAMTAGREHDPARSDLIDFLDALHLVLRGYDWVTAKELLGALREPGPAQQERTDALDILAAWTSTEVADLTAKGIGYALRSRVGRRVGGFRLVTDGDRRGENGPRHRGGVRYRVEATVNEEATP